MTEVRKKVAQRLAAVKKKLLATNPILHPPGKLPIAAMRYRPMLISGRQAKTKVNPGRLRRSTANGLRWTGGSGLRGLSPTGTKVVTISWGLGVREYGGGDLPYGSWVSQMQGTATGGGMRFQWDTKFRKWLAKILRTEILKVNKEFGLQGSDQIFFRKGINL